MQYSRLLDHPFGEAYAAAQGGALTGARTRLLTEGLPGPKREEWRFTPLRALAKVPFVPATTRADLDVADVLARAPQVPGAARIVLVNGRLRADLSDLAVVGVDIRDSGEAVMPEGDLPLVLLNAAYTHSALEVNVSGRADRPLHFISIGAAFERPAAFHPRTVIKVATGADATVFESHLGRGGATYFSNPVCDIVLAAGATLRRFVLVRENADAFHLGTTIVQAAKGAAFDGFHLGTGGGLVRQEVNITLAGEDAHVRLNGAYALDGDSHHDFTTVMNHDVPNCRSDQVFKGVVDGDSRGIYQGRIVVARAAQKTDAQQLHKALFLARGPQIDCKPELEIYADDVKCAHGAATGELDPDHVFYLAARGIAPAEARRLLVQGFLADALANVEDAAAQEIFLAEIAAWLARRSA